MPRLRRPRRIGLLMADPSQRAHDLATDAYRDALAYVRAYRAGDHLGMAAVGRNAGPQFHTALAALSSLLAQTLAASYEMTPDALLAWITEQVLAT